MTAQERDREAAAAAVQAYLIDTVVAADALTRGRMLNMFLAGAAHGRQEERAKWEKACREHRCCYLDMPDLDRELFPAHPELCECRHIKGESCAEAILREVGRE